MTPQAQRTAIAETQGWKRIVRHHFDDGVEKFAGYYQDPQFRYRCVQPWQLPDYPNDLNAMHEAEKVLTSYQQSVFANVLDDIVKFRGGNWFGAIHAPATQRAEAFLRTVGRWDESK